MSRTGTLGIIVFILAVGYRAFIRYGTLRDTNSPANSENFTTKAMISIHCSKQFQFLGKLYIIPIDRDVNCSSTLWKGRNSRNAVCTELAKLEAEEEEGSQGWTSLIQMITGGVRRPPWPRSVLASRNIMYYSGMDFFNWIGLMGLGTLIPLIFSVQFSEKNLKNS